MKPAQGDAGKEAAERDHGRGDMRAGGGVQVTEGGAEGARRKS